VQHIVVSETELNHWSPRLCWQMRLAQAWARSMPRGKGWVPRQLGRLVPRGSRTRLTLGSGAIVAVYPGSFHVYSALEQTGGTWDPHVVAACTKLLSPGDLFIDIGANVGLVCIDVCHRLGGSISVVAFEPQAELANTIAISAAMNRFAHFDVFSAMVSSDAGNETLHVPFYKGRASSRCIEKTSTSVRCPKVTLDGLLKSQSISYPSVIKVDVEGAELDVFRGAKHCISSAKPSLVFETNSRSALFGYSLQELCTYLKSLAPYSFFALTADGTIGLDKVAAGVRFSDVVAVVPEKANRLLS
jgi:FkbM family methyltransferase